MILGAFIACIPQDEVLAVFDVDSDGWTLAEDCDATDPLIHPDAAEVCVPLSEGMLGDLTDESCDFLPGPCGLDLLLSMSTPGFSTAAAGFADFGQGTQDLVLSTMSYGDDELELLVYDSFEADSRGDIAPSATILGLSGSYGDVSVATVTVDGKDALALGLPGKYRCSDGSCPIPGGDTLFFENYCVPAGGVVYAERPYLGRPVSGVLEYPTMLSGTLEKRDAAWFGRAVAAGRFQQADTPSLAVASTGTLDWRCAPGLLFPFLSERQQDVILVRPESGDRDVSELVVSTLHGPLLPEAFADYPTLLEVVDSTGVTVMDSTLAYRLSNRLSWTTRMFSVDANGDEFDDLLIWSGSYYDDEASRQGTIEVYAGPFAEGAEYTQADALATMSLGLSEPTWAFAVDVSRPEGGPSPGAILIAAVDQEGRTRMTVMSPDALLERGPGVSSIYSVLDIDPASIVDLRWAGDLDGDGGNDLMVQLVDTAPAWYDGQVHRQCAILSPDFSAGAHNGLDLSSCVGVEGAPDELAAGSGDVDRDGIDDYVFVPGQPAEGTAPPRFVRLTTQGLGR